jgi:hypothetical protein
VGSVAESVQIQDLDNWVPVSPSIFDKVIQGSILRSQIFRQDINIDPAQLNDRFELLLLNGDGEEHSIVACESLILRERLSCRLNNLRAWYYRALYRMHSVQIYLNGRRLTDGDDFNQKVARLKIPIQLQLTNKLEFRYRGWPFSSFQVKINRLILNQAPIAKLNVQVLDNTASPRVRLDAGASSDSTGTIAGYQWSVNGVALTTPSNSPVFEFQVASGTSLNIKLVVTDSFGLTSILDKSIALQAPITFTSAKIYTKTLPTLQTLKFSLTGTATQVAVLGASQTTDLGSGSYQADVTLNASGDNAVMISFKESDGTGLSYAVNVPVTIDNIIPIISSNITSGSLTKETQVTSHFSVTDLAPVWSTLTSNGLQGLQTAATEFDFPITLIEGSNRLELSATDGAGNISAPQVWQIVRDSVAPSVALSSPVSGATLNSLVVNVVGSANENISTISVNGSNMILSTDQRSFTGTVTFANSGSQNLVISAIDLAGNVSQQIIPVIVQNNSTGPGGGNYLWTYEECSVNGGGL